MWLCSGGGGVTGTPFQWKKKKRFENKEIGCVCVCVFVYVLSLCASGGKNTKIAKFKFSPYFKISVSCVSKFFFTCSGQTLINKTQLTVITPGFRRFTKTKDYKVKINEPWISWIGQHMEDAHSIYLQFPGFCTSSKLK